MFCRFVEAEVEEAGSKIKNPGQAQGARYSVQMKYLYPDNPEKRFRSAQTPTEKAGPSASGEEFFAKNFGQRREA
ncbi:tail assembly chaperone [Gordonia phage LilyPad]|nr:tail assembly chaperone [Gordonia phage LilyPad]